MDISRAEQRILHLLAQGGHIEIIRNQHNKPEDLYCFTRDGSRYPGLSLRLFRKLSASAPSPRRAASPTASRGGGWNSSGQSSITGK